jgi:RimJ/RimL family protein N-acetyltransferase
MKYLFFSICAANIPAYPAVDKSAYTAMLWRPSRTRIAPRGVFKFSFIVWWIFHYLRIFKNRYYGIFLFYDGDKVIHYSCLFPGYFRFPFMFPRDLQIGDVFTDESYRDRALATRALQEIVHLHRDVADRFWFITDEANAPSIRVAEKAGFQRTGEGSRTRRLKMKFLGAYVIEKKKVF